MIARAPRKVNIITTGNGQQIRDTSQGPPVKTILYYDTGGGTIEIFNASAAAAADRFKIPAGVLFEDVDQTHNRFAKASGSAVDLYIQEYDA
jgi:hypothetical protein